jgi:hypothetical protein
MPSVALRIALPITVPVPLSTHLPLQVSAGAYALSRFRRDGPLQMMIMQLWSH